MSDPNVNFGSAVSPVDAIHSPEASTRVQYGASPLASHRGSNDTVSHDHGLLASKAGSSNSLESHYHSPTDSNGVNPFIKRSESTSSYTLSPTQKTPVTTFPRSSSFGTTDAQRFQAPPHNGNFYRRSSMTGAGTTMPLRSNSSSSTIPSTYGPTSMEATMSQLPQYIPQNEPTSAEMQYHNHVSSSSASFAAAVSNSLHQLDPSIRAPYSGDPVGVEMYPLYSYPIFGGDEYNRSPNTMADDFAAWLFNGQNPHGDPNLPFNQTAGGMIPGYTDSSALQFQGPYYPEDASASSYPTVIPNHPMSVMSLLDSSKTNMTLSEDKRQELLDMMSTQFNERPHDAVKRRKQAVFEGDIDSNGHILSLRMMEIYIGSYWYHQHAQLPILHRPTFNADKTPNLLLLAVIAIGAATLDKLYTELTLPAAEFANFIAWHIRWEILRDADFQPPAKLWVFQTLLLIEVYEKMYATRALHERAHIHHDTTLTLMRRGSSLIGRSAFDSPPSMRDVQTGNSSGSTSATDSCNTHESWHQWIRNEATRRAAFAAFVIDSTHATMFGHSAKMVAHEMRLPLPCDEALWSATSSAEVARVQSTLRNNDIKPIMFLDSLKRTLNGARVRTNSFGRTIIMAGLLSVSWHMNQRDLSITSLGAPSLSTRGERWRSAILRAFDNWKGDFDAALAEAQPQIRLYDSYNVSNPNSVYPQRIVPFHAIDDENIFESRTVLHHLAHIASHIDIVDCQIFAGASRLLGRSITPKDYSNVQEKITDRWAKRATARDAAFYALKFIKKVMIPPEENNTPDALADGAILGHAFYQKTYYARDDFLLNRPWILYFSALVIWCYGFALEGPISNAISATDPEPQDLELPTPESRDADMRAYLDRVGGVVKPDDLENVKGKNRCMGLLMILKDSFEGTRWELTREAANLLGHCINKLKGIGVVGKIGSVGGNSGGGTPIVSLSGFPGTEARGVSVSSA